MYKELEEFFSGRTFGDYLLRPRKNLLFSRKDADLTMPLTKKIELRGIPIIPANMRTVTGGRISSEAAVNGTVTFLPRSYSIDDVVERIGYVKRRQAHKIENPLVLHRKATIKEARELMRIKKISGLLVEETPGSMILAGILSHRDIFGKDHEIIETYMTPCPSQVTFSNKDISMEDAEGLMNEIRKEKLPLLDEHRKIVGLITMRDLKRAKNTPYSTKDSKGRLFVGVTVGAKRGSDYMERAEAAIEAGADIILMDVAHGHSVIIEESVYNLKHKFPNVELIVGNVATREGARFLAEIGADAIKVGIGPGSGCRTRIETGFGVPQLQAVREAWLAVNHDLNSRIPIIADGGIKYASDVAMAIACGASTVMMGNLFAGTEEAPGRKYWDAKERRYMKKYGGETSPEIRLEQYSQEYEDGELDDPGNLEGQSAPVPYVGPVSNLFRRLRDSLQSSVTYGGVKRLRDFHSELTIDIQKYIIPLSESAKKESWDR
jgi:IMP dehydrogenase